MIDGKTLNLYKLQMLRILEQYAGIEAREDQLVLDAHLHLASAVRPDDVRQTLAALKDGGYAQRRVDDFRGPVWRITPEGHAEAAKIALEDTPPQF